MTWIHRHQLLQVEVLPKRVLRQSPRRSPKRAGACGREGSDLCAGRHIATLLKVSNNVSSRESMYVCALSVIHLFGIKRKTQEDEGCQLEDNAGQIDTTLQHYAFPLALAMHKKFFDEIFRWMASHAS